MIRFYQLLMWTAAAGLGYELYLVAPYAGVAVALAWLYVLAHHGYRNAKERQADRDRAREPIMRPHGPTIIDEIAAEAALAKSPDQMRAVRDLTRGVERERSNLRPS